MRPAPRPGNAAASAYRDPADRRRGKSARQCGDRAGNRRGSRRRLPHHRQRATQVATAPRRQTSGRPASIAVAPARAWRCAPRGLCDGRGAQRIVVALLQSLHLAQGGNRCICASSKPATKSRLMDWQRARKRGAMRFNPAIPSLEEHHHWLNERLSSVADWFLIAEVDGEPWRLCTPGLDRRGQRPPGISDFDRDGGILSPPGDCRGPLAGGATTRPGGAFLCQNLAG